MCATTWRKHSKIAASATDTAAQKSMAKAVAEEIKFAIENGHVINGIPYITVQGDGAYQKRSYQHSRHNSPGCSVVII